jgi:SHS2 domain-containing protein
VGLKVYGKDLKELYENAAFGMFSLIAELKKVRLRQSIEIRLEAPDVEELFLLWLSELLYQHSSRRIIFKEFLIDGLDENTLSARAKGEKLDLKRHRLKAEIKAVTYHGLKVERVKDRWQGQVIFDI